jgi:hypothetical protein
MTPEQHSKLPHYRWMQSSIPVRDALSTFVPNSAEPDPIISEMSDRCHESVWFEAQGGHRVLFPYDGGPYDQSRFTLERQSWDYDECGVCSERIRPMTPCYVTTPGQPYILVCNRCYQCHIFSEPPAQPSQ